MANTYSFDIVSEVNMQEIDNAINQASKELAQRFDFKGSHSSIEFLREKKQIVLIADDDMKLRGLKDILAGRLAKRGIALKALQFKDPEKAFEGTLRQIIDIVQGIPKDKAKDIVKIIKDRKLKIQPQIEGDKIRISSPSKDELQQVINLIKTTDFDIPLSCINYR